MKTFYLCWFIMVLMFLVIGISLVAIRTQTKSYYDPLETNEIWFHSEEYKRTKRLHRFHGIGLGKEPFGSFVDEQGNEWFYRDGKKCKLWDYEERRR